MAPSVLTVKCIVLVISVVHFVLQNIIHEHLGLAYATVCSSTTEVRVNVHTHIHTGVYQQFYSCHAMALFKRMEPQS